MIAVVADGGPRVGLGHLGRSSAVAVALRARGLAVRAYAYGAEQARTLDGVQWVPYTSPPGAAVVLDSYTMPAAERAALAPLAVFHDEGELPDAALVIRSGAESPDARVLAGLRHAPLRPPFWGVPERRVRPRVERVLVTTGGGALNAAGLALAALAREALPGASVALVRGPQAEFEAPAGVELVDAPPSLVDELRGADVVLSAAGQTALEAAATGAATIALPLVSNQRANAAALAEAGAAMVCEVHDAGAALAELDFERRVALAGAGQRAVDGFGALRIAFRIAELL
jgi:spore coat polysaccharide biosynthesis predicted glycosyltransferase SpsG